MGSKTYGYPLGIALDSQNNAYVTDYSRNTILVYERMPLEFVSQNNSSQTEGGGCLIATATYGSEMASEVQQLREIRDNTLLNTQSGKLFMNSFNDVYYSFSPIVADLERENQLFKEVVKLFITPMISSLSILNYVEMDSESEVLGYGVSLILLNVGMYLGIPAVVIIGIKKKLV
jgi:NHL repeat.